MDHMDILNTKKMQTITLNRKLVNGSGNFAMVRIGVHGVDPSPSMIWMRCTILETAV